MTTYLYQLKGWPDFTWEQGRIFPKLVALRHRQGRLLGRMEVLDFNLQAQANLHTLTLNVLKSSEVEGEILDPLRVRSSIARRLNLIVDPILKTVPDLSLRTVPDPSLGIGRGPNPEMSLNPSPSLGMGQGPSQEMSLEMGLEMSLKTGLGMSQGRDMAGLESADSHDAADRPIEGIVEMTLDASQNHNTSLTGERLFGWHAATFPTGRSGMNKVLGGRYRDNTKANPMQIVSGPMGNEQIHFQAPDSELLGAEMATLLGWYNGESDLDLYLKAAISHLWFATIHPFDEGNGIMTRAITDMQLSRSDQTHQRFYSLSSQISIEQNAYYDILEKTQKGSLDITDWLEWFLGCLDRAIASTDETLAFILKKSRFWGWHVSASLNDRQRMMLNKVLEGFGGKLTSSKWAGMTGSSQDTAGRDINDLVRRGILVKESGGGRSTGYLLAAGISTSH